MEIYEPHIYYDNRRRRFGGVNLAQHELRAGKPIIALVTGVIG
jgi:hypothetical protein